MSAESRELPSNANTEATQAVAWAQLYDSEGGHAVIVKLLLNYAALLRRLAHAEPNGSRPIALYPSEIPQDMVKWVLYSDYEAALAHSRSQDSGGEAVAGTVVGYLPALRSVEIRLDGDMPEWIKEAPKRAYVASRATLDAVGRRGKGHNADWCAGWNAHNLTTATPPPKVEAQQAIARKLQDLRDAINDVPEHTSAMRAGRAYNVRDNLTLIHEKLSALANPPQEPKS